MTLVVSEISRDGITMVGDSAITIRENGTSMVISGASKIQYASKLNIGFAIWGNAHVGSEQIDKWVNNFINYVDNNLYDIDYVANKFTKYIKAELEQLNKPWSDKVFGIHVAGYKNGLPRLWHIHCGHANEVPHEPRLYHDYPEDQNISDFSFQKHLLNPSFFCHLRNGYITHYAQLFKHIRDYSNTLEQQFKISFPKPTLEGRLKYYKILVRFVADVLEASGAHQGVNNKLSAIAFNENGIIIDERCELNDWLSPIKNKATLSFHF